MSQLDLRMKLERAGVRVDSKVDKAVSRDRTP